MKITDTDYDSLKRGMFETLKVHNLHPFMVKNTGHAWDLFHKAWNEKRVDGNALYKYLTDANLETAFRRMFK